MKPMPQPHSIQSLSCSSSVASRKHPAAAISKLSSSIPHRRRNRSRRREAERVLLHHPHPISLVVLDVKEGAQLRGMPLCSCPTVLQQQEEQVVLPLERA